MFRYTGDTFRNERGKYVSVQNKENIVVRTNNNDSWSRWNVRYVKDEETYQPGEFHPRYGFYCNRDFYIVSKKDQRYLSYVSRQVMIKVRNGQKGQKWQFNCKSETIVS
jgi:hypothetical protein